MLNSCGNLYLNTLTFASLVCLCRGSIRPVSWQILRASLGAISPQTQARRACQLNSKHSRFRVRTWDSAPVETPQSSLEATRYSPLEDLPLEVRGTTGCTRVLGEGIGATEHEWRWWCFGATEHLYPYRMKCGLGGSMAQNTTAIGDFTKYGQPVPRPDPTRGVGIAHF